MPAGRPPEVDSNGKAIEKCLVNATIPTKLRDFLRQHNINRSDLFRSAALKLMEYKICPSCYSHDIKETPKGWRCDPPLSRKEYYTTNKEGGFGCGKWLKFKRCQLCEAAHTPKSALASVNGKVGCDFCPEYLQQVEDNKKINVVFGNDL